MQLTLDSFRVIPLNQLYKPVLRNGKCTMILTKEGKECKKLIQMEVLRLKKKNVLSGDVSFYMDIIRKGKQSPDIDGLLKITQDSLEGLFYKNDKQIVDLRVRKHLNQNESDKVIIEVKEIVDDK